MIGNIRNAKKQNKFKSNKWLTTSCSFFFETVIVFVDEMVDVVVVFETFVVLPDPDTDKDIFIAVQKKKNITHSINDIWLQTVN